MGNLPCQTPAAPLVFVDAAVRASLDQISVAALL
jgi:hypothetical protein